MNRASFLKLALLVVVVSCAMHANDVEHSQQSSLNEQQPGPYPSSIPTSQPSIQDQGSWVCGSEWIVVKGPKGELIINEIPLNCDPFSDMNTGDPSPIDQEKQNKKAPGLPGQD